MARKAVQVAGNPKWPASNIEWRQTRDLLAYQRNSRIHSDAQVDQIAASMKEFGWTIPMLIDEDGIIIAGHGRALAAAKIGISEVPVMIAKGWTEAQKMAYRIADNRLPESASWDTDMLKLELTELGKMDFDLSLTGFDDLELVQFMATPNVNDAEEIPEPPLNPASSSGDLWVSGRHRLLCGDSVDIESVAMLMGDSEAELCFTSPPYAQQRDYGIAKDQIADWDRLMRGVFENSPMAASGQVLVNLGIVHQDGEWFPYWDGWIEWMRSEGWRRFGWYIWDKGAGMPGEWNGRLAPSHEFIFHFTQGSIRAAKKWIRTKGRKELTGRRFRQKDGSLHNPTSPSKIGQDWKVPDSVLRINSEKTRGIHTQNHPAVFPVDLPKFALNTWPGKSVYDPFSGAGTTIIACEGSGRDCFALEIEPAYVDVAVQRWQTYTGQEATLEATGETYAEVADKRLNAPAKPARKRKAAV